MQAATRADAPPRDEVGPSHVDSFMMMRRKLKNCLECFIALVKKSATFMFVEM